MMESRQFSLWDTPPTDSAAGRAGRDAGTALVVEHHESDVSRVQAIILAIIDTDGECCADGVWEFIDWPVAPPVVGTAFSLLARSGRIVKVRYVQAKRPNQHAATIWYWKRGAD